MYALKIYNWTYGELDDILYFHSKENADAKAREAMRYYLDDCMADKSPEKYECKSWDEFVERAIDDWGYDEVFSMNAIIFED